MEIQESENYALFVIPNWQRAVNQNAVLDMAGRMEAENPIIARAQPISCIEIAGKEPDDEKSLLIVDGQHRYESWKLLGRKIVFTVLPHGTITAEKVAEMNSNQKPWQIKDYVKSYASRNKDGYIWYKRLVDDYELNMGFFRLFYLSQIHEQFAGVEEGYLAHFKSGKFNPSEEFKRAAKLFCIDLDSLQQEMRGTDSYKRSSQYHFMRSFSILRKHPSFDLNSFKAQMAKYHHMLTPSNHIEDTVSEMTAIYNYRKRAGKIDATFSKVSNTWYYR